jgi:hypothetical protein
MYPGVGDLHHTHNLGLGETICLFRLDVHLFSLGLICQRLFHCLGVDQLNKGEDAGSYHKDHGSECCQ